MSTNLHKVHFQEDDNTYVFDCPHCSNLIQVHRSPPGLEPEFDSIRLTCNEFPRRSSKFTEFIETVPAESVRNSF